MSEETANYAFADGTLDGMLEDTGTQQDRPTPADDEAKDPSNVPVAAVDGVLGTNYGNEERGSGLRSSSFVEIECRLPNYDKILGDLPLWYWYLDVI